ncbi:hypothetical protein [uncultured Sanguibacteroides sp.]|uniref:hypothetical protein n=1 Tax=uncultured Sanguibacteroides sp. TaxID=1635151 RepID=UPI0025E3E47B|nr:hypothetical protein [uncultured Sanguibacteroides sp.]
MKQTLTFNLSTIASTESKLNVDSFDTSVEAFENKEYLRSFYALLDYINAEFRTKYGNVQGTEFDIPHGSIVVNLKLEDDWLKITAPFLSIPEKGRIPLLRRIAGLNFNHMDLARISLQDDRLFFEYSCPIALINPYKIYYVLEEICRVGDKYDDEFEAKFGAKRIYEPKVTPYDAQTVDSVYDVVQLSCKECMDAVSYFEGGRKYGYAWNVVDTTLLKILYYAHPQGQLLNDLNKAVIDMDREDIPLPEVVAHGKEMVVAIQAMTKDQLAENLYFVETFIPGKRRSNLKNIQENFENTYDRASNALEAEDYMTCCLLIIYKFYEMYFYNNVQDDVNALVVKALQETSAKSWEEAASILHEAMDDIMEGNLEPEEEMDMSQYMQNVQQMQQQAMQAMQGVNMEEIQKMQQQAMQAMQGVNMEEYMKNVQNMMASMFGGNNNDNNDK